MFMKKLQGQISERLTEMNKISNLFIVTLKNGQYNVIGTYFSFHIK